MEVAPGLHRIDTPLGTRVSGLYLIVGDDSILLFDTGVTGAIGDYVLPYLAQQRLDPQRVRTVVVSHCDIDHCGGIGDAIAAFPAAVTIAHDLDADQMEDYPQYEARRAREFRDIYGWDEDPEVLAWARSVTNEGPITLRLTSGVRVDLGGRVVEVRHAPGHSLGHLALFDAAANALIVSDAVLGDAVPHADGSPAFPPTYRYVTDYLRTIDDFRSTAADLLLTAHYPDYRGSQVIDFLDLSQSFAVGLESAVADAVHAGPATLEQLLTLLAGVGRWPAEGTLGALAFPVVGHLERLCAQGLVRRRDQSWPAVFETAR